MSKNCGPCGRRHENAEKEGKIVAKHLAYDESKGMKCGGKVKKMAAGGRTSAKGMHSVQTKSKRGAIQVAMKKGGKC